MALKKPAFENVDFNDNVNTATEGAPWDDGEAAAPAAAPATPEQAKVEATTAIAKAATTSVATVSEEVKNFQKEFDSMRGAFDTAYGNFKVFKADNGEIRDTTANSNLSLGRDVTVRLMGWDFFWQVAPGDDGAKAKEFVAFSNDGETIEHVVGEDMRHFVGKPISEYVEYLRAEGFDKAESKRYLNTVCAVLDSESGKHEPGELIQVTLAPTSVSSFTSYQERLKGLARGAQLGLPGFALPADPFTFKYVAVSASRGSNRWTKLNVEPVKG